MEQRAGKTYRSLFGSIHGRAQWGDLQGKRTAHHTKAPAGNEANTSGRGITLKPTPQGWGRGLYNQRSRHCRLGRHFRHRRRQQMLRHGRRGHNAPNPAQQILTLNASRASACATPSAMAWRTLKASAVVPPCCSKTRGSKGNPASRHLRAMSWNRRLRSPSSSTASSAI